MLQNVIGDDQVKSVVIEVEGHSFNLQERNCCCPHLIDDIRRHDMTLMTDSILYVGCDETRASTKVQNPKALDRHVIGYQLQDPRGLSRA